MHGRPGSVRFSDLAQHLYDQSLSSLPIPFSIEHALPGTQIELRRCDGNDYLVSYREASEVGGRIVLTGLVVLVASRLPWGDGFLQPFEDVVPEAGLMI